jgi:Flp pilus assembly protein TadD
MVWLVFGQTLRHDFVNYDDDSYVYENLAVTQGLTWHGIASAFTHSDLYLWTPLTRISHMLDVQFYRLNPAGHHLTNLLLHAAAATVLFLALQKLTGAIWPSAIVATLFAIHPLHVESVAWISERKDVLSGLFFMLTLWAYERYARHPWSAVRYLLVVLFFVLGLLSKPMLVTVPFVLLFLDYWPLQRFASPKKFGNHIAGEKSENRFSIPRGILLEKIPLLFFSGALVCLALFDPFGWNEPRPEFSPHPLLLRISNALASYAIYIWQMFYPANLTVRYPFPTNVPAWQIVLSFVLLLTTSAWAFRARRERPYLLVGWLWYIGMLLPVIGVVELGGEARSDRYTYLPQIGLYMLVTWLALNMTRSWRRGREMLGVAGAIVLAVLIWCACAQASTWRDSESLWTHALAVTSNNYLAHNNLGKALLEKGEVGAATRHFQAAVEIQRNDALALSNLGVAMTLAGNAKEGVKYAFEATRIRPKSPVAHNNLGFVLLRAGDSDGAILHCTEAVQLKPDWAEANGNLGSALIAQGKVAEGLAHFREALRLKPDSSTALNNLAWLLATCRDEQFRNGAEALVLAERAAKQTRGNDPSVLDTLAAALAENGHFDEAVATATRARELAFSRGDHELAARVNERLELYRQRLAYRK